MIRNTFLFREIIPGQFCVAFKWHKLFFVFSFQGCSWLFNKSKCRSPWSCLWQILQGDVGFHSCSQRYYLRQGEVHGSFGLLPSSFLAAKRCKREQQQSDFGLLLIYTCLCERFRVWIKSSVWPYTELGSPIRANFLDSFQQQSGHTLEISICKLLSGCLFLSHWSLHKLLGSPSCSSWFTYTWW